jgi:hypothetical protein
MPTTNLAALLTSPSPPDPLTGQPREHKERHRQRPGWPQLRKLRVRAPQIQEPGLVAIGSLQGLEVGGVHSSQARFGVGGVTSHQACWTGFAEHPNQKEITAPNPRRSSHSPPLAASPPATSPP